jgi:uncharacterized protein YbjT (DUF2867 family)
LTQRPELNVVTGAFGFTGRYIAGRLLAAGKDVRTLISHPGRKNPFGARVEAFPLRFADPESLAGSLRWASTLYNTYWIRFPRGRDTFAKAVANTKVLLASARQAGVGRIVHISVTNALPDSPLPYFRAKAEAEEAVRGCGLPYAIIRPTLIFGAGDILINNIAHLLRRFPFFAVFGAGDYRLQPVYVEDLADLAVELGTRADNLTIDAAGPETLTFEQLVRAIAGAVGREVRIVHLSPGLAFLLSRLVDWFVRDVLVTPDEIDGLMSDLLISHDPPRCKTRFTDWLERNADAVGREYASELARHYR